MKNKSLAEKLQDPVYLNNLSERRQREIQVCKKIFSEEELESESSIQVGYQKARKRFIKDRLTEINPEYAERALKEHVPVFNILEMLENDNDS